MTKEETFVEKWKSEFIERARIDSKSKKQQYSIYDAIGQTGKFRTALDDAMVMYFKFVTRKPLRNNDYFKYVNAYRHGKKLDLKYYRHDVDKLMAYYKKIDEVKGYNPFKEDLYKKYVLFMVLKFAGCYVSEYDEMFNVKIEGSREYNPLTSIPSVLRAELPFNIKEYDIAQAYPTFMFQELKMEPFNVYERIDKRKFNMLLNMQHEVKGAKIEDVREQLKPIYGSRVNEVITEERFMAKGQMFEDMAKHEKYYIEQFVAENNVERFVRLHDGVITLASDNCQKVEFGDVKFKIKEFNAPELKHGLVTFYNEWGVTSSYDYKEFLKQEGFFRIAIEGQDEVTIVRGTDKILELFRHKTDLIPFLQSSINELDTEDLENTIAKENSTKIKDSLLLLDVVQLTYHRDTKNRVDLPFRNGVVRITADEIKLVPYSDIEGFFHKHPMQEHEIKLIPKASKPSQFEEFLTLACTAGNDNDEVKNAFFSMFGYLISNHKDQAKNYAVILSDEGADGESRNGGRGKSILQNALKCFRPYNFKGGEEYVPSYIHIHGDLKKHQDVYIIDDVPRNFNYNALYTNISNGIFCQMKGKEGHEIPFEYTPKFVISTNWAFRYNPEATSTNRRFREYKFSNYWNVENTPRDYFGATFFSEEWSQKEWNAFYNFGFHCVQIFLRDGLQAIEYDKREDNFLAYFSNDAKIQEMERIMEVLKGERSFNVTRFLEVHGDCYTYKYLHKPLFSINDARTHIDAYIEYMELRFKYKKMTRMWERVS
ncbi:hypothetical protein [Chryseobacterium sp. A321]